MEYFDNQNQALTKRISAAFDNKQIIVLDESIDGVTKIIGVFSSDPDDGAQSDHDSQPHQ